MTVGIRCLVALHKNTALGVRVTVRALALGLASTACTACIIVRRPVWRKQCMIHAHKLIISLTVSLCAWSTPKHSPFCMMTRLAVFVLGLSFILPPIVCKRL